MSSRNTIHRKVSALFLALCALIFSPGVDAASISLPPVDDLIEDGHRAHQACRESRTRSIEWLQTRGTDLNRGGSVEQEKYDITYYRLEMKFDRPNSRIYGNVSMTADVIAPLTVCEVNCYWMMWVDSVWVDGQRTTFDWNYEVLSINLGTQIPTGEKFTVRTFYHGYEQDFQWWSLLFETYDGLPVMGNLSEPFYARTWWPCKDFPNDKADSLDFFVTYPSDQFCASNGTLVSDVDNANGFRTTHWSVRYPIATYLVSVAMAHFTHWQEWALRSGTDSLQVDYWVYPSVVPAAQQSFAFTVTAIDTLSRLFGIYPFKNEKYAMSNYPWEGSAMEHQTNTSMSPSISGSVMTVVHELAHQWWGDMITCRDWHHIWLNEGFASYSEALFIETLLGTQALHDYMVGMQYFSPGSVYCRDTTQAWTILDGIVYDKGAWVLHMLRGVVGDQAFFAGLRAYGDSPLKYGTAVTEDFQHYMEQASGQELDWYFQEWVYGYGNPSYQYRWQCVLLDNGNYRLDLVIEQVQTEYGAFTMPIQMRFITTGAVVDDTLWNNLGFQIYQMEFPDSVTAIQFDPSNWILDSSVEKPFELLITTRNLPDGEETVPYYFELDALGGVSPYSWVFQGGDLPFGLEFTGGDQGIISGIPTYPETYYFTISVTDSDNPPRTQLQGFALTIRETIHYGDCNYDGRIDIADVVFLINFIFAGGEAPSPIEAGDADCNGFTSISDAVVIINYLFSGGSAPCH